MKNKFYFIGSLAIIVLSIFNTNANAQPHIDFTYDAAGNRIQRQYYAFKTMGDPAPSDPAAEETAAQYGITVYPNPLMDGTSATVTIQGKTKSSESDKTNTQAIIYVLDNTGKVLFSQKQTSPSTEIDLGNYSAGIYYIKVAIDKEQLFYKVLKAK